MTTARPRGVRLLPVTVLALAALLAAKSVRLVQAAGMEDGTAQAAEPPTVPPTTVPQPAVPPLAAAGMAGVASPLSGAAPAPAPAAAPESPVSPAERALLQDLRHRRAQLDAREATLAQREALLAAEQTRLSARLDELAALRQRLEQIEAARRAHEQSNWQGLVRVYEAMRSKDAAAIFNDLELPVLLQVADRMREVKLSAVIAAMAPDRARLLTAELAHMRAGADAVSDAAAPAATLLPKPVPIPSTPALPPPTASPAAPASG